MSNLLQAKSINLFANKKQFINITLHIYYAFYSLLHKKMKNTKKQASKLATVKLYDVKQEELNEQENFILENQKRDLKKASKQKLNIDLFAKELVFYDLLMKENRVNKRILELDLQKKKDKLCKSFVNEFYFQNTPNEKNYEKLLIEKLTNEFIIDYIKNSYSENDRIDIDSIEKTIEALQEIKEEYRKIWFENIEDSKKQKEIVSEYRKNYQKFMQKQLKARYRLNKKYSFLVA